MIPSKHCGAALPASETGQINRAVVWYLVWLMASWLFPPHFCIYVISTLDTLFLPPRRRNYPSLTPHDTHNMGFHVLWRTCLCKTTDSALDQWAPAAAIPSRSPWKPVASNQLEGAKGGAWIEVARWARRFASRAEPERSGEGPLTTVSTRLKPVSHWGMLDVLTECSARWSVFALTWHRGRPEGFLCRRHRFVSLNLSVVAVVKVNNREKKKKLRNEIRCAHARQSWLLYFLYFYNLKMPVRAFLSTRSERKMWAFVKWPLGGREAAV